MTTHAAQSQARAGEAVNSSRIWLAGVVAVIAAVGINLLARAVMFAILPLPAEFPPLGAPAIMLITTVGLVLATFAYALIVRFSSRPVTTFRWVAGVALVLSIVPNFISMANPAAIPFPFPGASALAFGALIVFHVLAALVCVFIFERMTRID